jgi:polyphosphate kinase
MDSNLAAIEQSENLIDRELSWLAFNKRVLELAEDKSIHDQSCIC